MNFSRIPNRTLVGKIIRFPLRFIPAEMTGPILQGKLRGTKWIVGSANHGCWLGSYEYEMRFLFEKTVTEGSIVFDIGANVGVYTLLASVLVGSEGQVLAFEPAPANTSYLKRHLRLNRMTNVTVIERAVTDSNGVTSFDNGLNSSMGFISPQGQVQVKTVSLDELISKGEIPTPDFMKIDVEGAEMLVLSGAMSMLGSALPTIFLATHGRDIHQQCCQFLASLGYQLQPVGSGSLESSDTVFAFRK